MSPTRAAGKPPIRTVKEPNEIIPGPAGTQDGRVHGVVMSLTRAAGCPPISTFGCPLTIVSGTGGCATGVGVGAGGWIGAWQCGASWRTMSPMRAAGLDIGFGPWRVWLSVNPISPTARPRCRIPLAAPASGSRSRALADSPYCCHRLPH